MDIFLSSVIVTEEQMASYLPAPSPPKIPSHATFLNTTLKPASLATTIIRSVSKPTISFFSFTYSIGGHVASCATTIVRPQAVPDKSTTPAKSDRISLFFIFSSENDVQEEILFQGNQLVRLKNIFVSRSICQG